MSTNRRQPTAALPLAVLTILLAACSSTPDRTASTTPTQQHKLFSAQIKHQLRRPDTRAIQAPPPPAFPHHLTTTLPDQDNEHAARTLASILTEIDAPTPPAASSDQSLPDLEGDALAALHAYVQGRTLLLTDGAVAAEPHLRAAARLDPDAPEPWHALADAQTELASAANATASYKRVLDRDPANIAALERLSNDALDRHDYNKSLIYLARLHTQNLAAIDPALPNIIDMRLGHTLLALGHTAAAAEAFINAATLPDQFNEPTDYIEELSRLYRQRPLLLLRAGDANLRLARFNDAAAAYALADSVPSSDDLHQILTRRIYALMKGGHSASAAGVLITTLDTQQGLVDAALLDLFRHVAHHSKAQPLLASALRERLGAAIAADNPVRGAHLALARAECLLPDSAPAALRHTLSTYPAHTAALRALLAASPSDAERTTETLALIDAHPEHTSIYVDALLGAQPASLFLDFLPADPLSPAPALLRAHLLLDAAAPTPALDALTPITPAHGPIHSHAVVLRASVLRMLARNDAIPALRTTLPPEAHLARAQIYLLLGQTTRASDALTEHLPSSVQHLTTGGYTAQVRGDVETARTLYERAIALATMDDTPYRRLLALLRPGGAAADPQGFADTYRELRAHIPWSAAVPFEHALSDVRSGHRSRAEQALSKLLIDHPREHSAANLLSELMYQRAEYGALDTMLRERLEQVPIQTAVLTRLAQVLSATGDHEGAAELLAQRLESIPGDADASRVLERLLRDKLGRRKEADDLAFARLARQAQSAESLLELFELYLEHDREQDAYASLTKYFSLDETRGAPFPARLIPVLARVTMQRDRQQENTLDGAVSLLDLVLTHRPGAPESVHLLRLDALISLTAPADRLVRALETLTGQYPAHYPKIYDLVTRNLLDKAVTAWQAGDWEARSSNADLSLELNVRLLEKLDAPRIETIGYIAASAHNLAHDPKDRERAADHIAAMLRLADLEPDFDRDALAGAYGLIFNPKPGDRLIAQVFSWFGDALNSTSHDNLSESMYRSAIRHDPQHVMSLNNLGYRLVERGEDLEEAHRLLARSHVHVFENDDYPVEAVIDSLGWVRYKLGMIEDGADDNGRRIPGALTLLENALMLAKKAARAAAALPNNADAGVSSEEMTIAIVSSHYGDALWSGGHTEHAIKVWREAYEKASSMLSGADESELNAETLRELELTRSSCGEKMRAASEDREPAVEMIVHALRPAEQPADINAEAIGADEAQDKDAF